MPPPRAGALRSVDTQVYRPLHWLFSCSQSGFSAPHRHHCRPFQDSLFSPPRPVYRFLRSPPGDLPFFFRQLSCGSVLVPAHGVPFVSSPCGQDGFPLQQTQSRFFTPRGEQGTFREASWCPFFIFFPIRIRLLFCLSGAINFRPTNSSNFVLAPETFLFPRPPPPPFLCFSQRRFLFSWLWGH